MTRSASSASASGESDAAEALIEKMRAVRGYLYPEVELAVRMDPEFMRSYEDLVDRVFLYSDEHAERAALAPKYRELIATTLLAQRGRVDHVVVHARRSLRLGATPEELLEAFEVALAPAGLPAFLTGLEALKEVLEAAEEDARGQGRAP